MLTSQRDLFALPEDTHYLNCAYMSPIPKTVADAGMTGIARKQVPSQIMPEDFFTDSNRARALFAQLVNTPEAQRIAILPAVSYGMAVVARNTLFEAGQNIVVAHEQFPSNVYPWHVVAQMHGLEVRTVKPPVRLHRGDEWSTRILEAVDRNTVIVASAPVHWTDGTCFDLEAIGTRARDCDAAFIVDGTQAVGAMPFDVERLKPDALICAAYKWLLGPYSIGLGYFGPRYDGGKPLENHTFARVGSEDFRNLVNYSDQYRPGAERYDVGEHANFVLTPMLIAALEQVLRWNLDEVEQYCRTLTAELFVEAEALGFGFEREKWRSAHLFGLYAPESVDLATVFARLRERKVFVSLRGRALRISPHLYNNATDVAALVEVLRAESR